MSKKDELDMRQNMRKKFPLYALFYLYSAVETKLTNIPWTGAITVQNTPLMLEMSLLTFYRETQTCSVLTISKIISNKLL